MICWICGKDIWAAEGQPVVCQCVKESITERISNREHFISLYLTLTGHPIDQIILVEQRMNDGKIRFWCELKDVKFNDK